MIIIYYYYILYYYIFCSLLPRAIICSWRTLPVDNCKGWVWERIIILKISLSAFEVKVLRRFRRFLPQVPAL